MIHSDLDMLFAWIHLVVKIPENYYSSLLQGFFRNNVCLFLRPLWLYPMSKAQYFSSRLLWKWALLRVTSDNAQTHNFQYVTEPSLSLQQLSCVVKCLAFCQYATGICQTSHFIQPLPSIHSHWLHKMGLHNHCREANCVVKSGKITLP